MHPLGTYEHFKGNRYRVICLAVSEATKEDMVVYQSLADDTVWVRPAIEFFGMVPSDIYSSNRIRRFKPVVP